MKQLFILFLALISLAGCHLGGSTKEFANSEHNFSAECKSLEILDVDQEAGYNVAVCRQNYKGKRFVSTVWIPKRLYVKLPNPDHGTLVLYGLEVKLCNGYCLGDIIYDYTFEPNRENIKPSTVPALD